MPRGLLYCLLSQPPHPSLKEQDCYFPDGFCQQKLLKTVADGRIKDNTLEHLMLQQDYARHWEQLHQDMFLILQGMQPLDRQDLRQLAHLFGLLQSNGLMVSLNMA